MTENKNDGTIKKYESEIREILYITENVKKGRYYELSGAKMDGSIHKNMSSIENKLKKLLLKIEGDKPSNQDIIAKLFEPEE